MLRQRQINLALAVGAVAIAASWLMGADNAYLYPISLAEARLGPKPRQTMEPCQPIVAAHAAYGQSGRFTGGSAEALDAAVADQVKNIEIDVSFFPSGPVLYHAMVPDVESALAVEGDAVSLTEFFSEYAQQFELIFFDLKNVMMPVREAVESLGGFPWDASRHIFIGRKCPLLREIQRAFDVNVGCEMHGVLGNWLMGFEVWSVRDTEVRSLQLRMNRWLDLPLLTWTLPTRRDVATTCHLKPTWVLVDIM